MMISRRSLLVGIAATAASPALPAMAAKIALAPFDYAVSVTPRIVGDGIHDDGPGLNALFDGSPVEILCKGVFRRDDGAVFLREGTYFLGTQPMRPRPDRLVDIRNCVFESGPDADCILRVVYA